MLAARYGEALKELADEINGRGGAAYAATTPIGNEDDREQRAQAAAQRFGRFDTWVGPVGVSIFGRVMDLSTKDMRPMAETDVPGRGAPA